ncbi:hypothetical protein [Methylobacterium iners]|uniref:hypothetical protein n=1 Tax=Methylobacterium iners TaxID=418707 RepID=UPI0035A2518B
MKLLLVWVPDPRVPNFQAEAARIIAATAIHHGLTFVTRDVGDDARTDVALFNPWSDPAA